MALMSRRAAALGAFAWAAAARAEPPGAGDAERLRGRLDGTSRLTVPVQIDGKGPFAFVVDTGANRSVIATELAAELGLPPGGPTKIHGILGLQDAATAEVHSFIAGRLRLPIAKTPVLSRSDLGCDGFLGLDAFRDRRVEFDFRRAQVSIFAGGFFDDDRPGAVASLTTDVVVRARQRFGQLTITEAEVVGRPISCFVDSGAQISVGNLAMLRALEGHAGRGGMTPIQVVLHGATGQDAEGEVAGIPTLRIGDLRFTNFAMPFADLHTFSLWGMQDRPAMMMGMDLLSLFQLVTVDFRDNAVRFRMAEAMAALLRS
jgi:predicted aspartyl protease